MALPGRFVLGTGFTAACCLLGSPHTQAQQFQEQVGVVPGPSAYTEGVECADVDRDGDLDVFYADGPNFSFAGPPTQNILHINQLVPTGTFALADESVARLGMSLSNAKMVFTGDVDSDGWVDALYANAFNMQVPYLYMNQGAGNPGFFSLESAARGLTTIHNSASGQFGDVDDDGDLDLILCDSGPSYFSNPGGSPALYLNDGTGNFSVASVLDWAPPAKAAQMDVRLVDIDGDFDLDFFGACRASNGGGNHYLMLNDGAGGFTDSSSSLPSTSTSVYEAEVADLDGDTDLDFFFTSLSGFNEGLVRNNLFPSGSLTLASAGTLSGSFDDNEVVLVDYDNDGDLDPLVGSLGGTEALWRNNGGLSFTAQFNQIQSVGDSTLDCTVADMDNDGDYDLLTAQGESGNFTNRYYENMGPADTRGPVVLRHQVPADLSSSLGPWVARAHMQDAVVDDGVNYCSARADYVVVPALSYVDVMLDGTGFTPSMISVPVGTKIRWTTSVVGASCVASATPGVIYESPIMGPGQTYEMCFATPGTYDYSNLLGPGAGSITVTGTPSTEPGFYAGGGIFRFAMSGVASSGSALIYQLTFTDYVGNERTEVFETVMGDNAPGLDFCSGDGGNQTGCTDCPCGNNAPAGIVGGCLNSAGTSTRLIALGDPSVSLPGGSTTDLQFRAAGAPPSSTNVLLSGNAVAPANMANPCFGLNSGALSGDRDGLRCAVQALVRHGNRTANASGEILDALGPNRVWGGPAQPTAGIASQGGFVSGQTRYFQITHRDDAMAVCMRGLNSSQAVGVTFTP